jgi:Uma2 family endonuclease
MHTVVFEDSEARIPDWVANLESFRRWAESAEFPEVGRICYLKGEVWVDMSKEQLFTHLQVKSKFNIVLGTLAETEVPGLYFPDGLLLTNLTADLSWKPDGTFISSESLRAGKVRLVEGEDAGYVELEGTPDLVLEVVSRSSVKKDTVVLRQAYGEAGIPEYWLVDARRDPLHFDILRHTARGYVPTRKQNGWVRSQVFGKSFRLTQSVSKLGYPEFKLDVR